MILVDSSVWIDHFRGNPTPQAERLDELLEKEPVAIGYLILTEVLQGFHSEKDFNRAKKLLTSLTVVDLRGQDIAIRAAKNCRKLCALGVRIRKTIDTVIATRCIESSFTLPHSDRDFDPFVVHLGLRSELQGTQPPDTSGSRGQAKVIGRRPFEEGIGAQRESHETASGAKAGVGRVSALIERR